MGKFSRLGNQLYNGGKSIDFIQRRSLWYTITAVIVAAAFASIFMRGLNFGIEFTGGTEYRVPVASSTQAEAERLRDAVAQTGIAEAESPTATTAGASVLIQVEEMTTEQTDQVSRALSEASGAPIDDIAVSEIGASWGQQVAKRAAIGVGVFLVLVLLFIGLYFREWKMSIAALVALVHDVVITIGVYALSGFQVTPSAVTGLLAILGFSLYDTVVVFDKVKENTAEMRKHRQTYAEAANLAVNQTLVRSVNTGIVALIPIGAILWVSAVQLGASSLQDLALSQFVGMAVGVYSSVFLAPRVLVHLKSSESDVKLAEKRAKARARAAADRYASVPVFKDDSPVGDDDDVPAELADDFDAADAGDAADDGSQAGRSSVGLAKRPRPTTKPGSGRTVPPARGEVSESASSGRRQPERKPRSQRGKK